MNRGEWILNLLKDYKQGLKERKINIDDDFIKFIRFAQWKLEQTRQGIFAMITSNTFIDGITHRQMRRSLMDTFDEIYIYNLHGNSRKGEIAPDGGKDENVFNIQQGVSINVFVKYPEKQKETIIKYCDLWGLREHKFATLLDENFEKTNWLTLSPKEPNWFLVPRDTGVEMEYEQSKKLLEVFPYYNSAIQTKRDALTIQFDEKDLQQIIKDFEKFNAEDLRAKYNLPADGRDWTIKSAKDDLKNNHPKIMDILYRPFDIRKTIFTGKTKGFIAYPRTEIMQNFLEKDNLGLFTKRQMQGADWSYTSVTKNIAESAMHFSSPSNPHLFPLYLYSESIQSNLLGQENRRPNLSSEFIRIFSEKLGFKFISEGIGDLEKTFGPEAVFYYAYSIFHSPTFRSRYAEQLKIDFPRLPLTSDKKLFVQLVRFGNELVNLHLLGENPFDKSKTIFDEPEKWGVKIGGAKPENLEDWEIIEVRYDEESKRVHVNSGQHFEGIEKDVWEFMIGGYQVCEKWLKYRKKARRALSTDDLKHYMKIVVALRESIRIMSEIDKVIPSWPIE